MERLRLLRQRSLLKARQRALARLDARYRALVRAGCDLWIGILVLLLISAIPPIANGLARNDTLFLSIFGATFVADYLLLRGLSIGEPRL